LARQPENTISRVQNFSERHDKNVATPPRDRHQLESSSSAWATAERQGNSAAARTHLEEASERVTAK
jgi:hypothetical protein